MRFVILYLLSFSAFGADWYQASGNPAPGSAMSSSVIRSEYSSIGASFAKMPALNGYSNLIIGVNPSGTALQAFANADVLTNIGAASTTALSTAISTEVTNRNNAITSAFNVPTVLGLTTPNSIFGTTISASTQFTGAGTGLTGTASGLSIGGNAATASALNSTATAKIFPISASVASNALTVTLSSTYLDFRSTSLTSGTVNTVNISSPISVTVPSGTILATQDGYNSRLAIIALYNGGSPVLGIANLNDTNLDETTLITTKPIATVATFTGSIATTGILTLSSPGSGTLALGMSITGTGLTAQSSGTYVKTLLTGTQGAAGSTYQTSLYPTIAVASTSISASAGIGVYTASAVTASPFRIVGFVDIAEGTSGTWATAPSTIQGVGGQALASLSSLGYGQTWQNVTASRALATRYYNTTGKPIYVSVDVSGGPNTGYADLYVDGVWLGRSGSASIASGSLYGTVSGIVPPNSSYYANGSGGLDNWAELR